MNSDEEVSVEVEAVNEVARMLNSDSISPEDIPEAALPLDRTLLGRSMMALLEGKRALNATVHRASRGLVPHTQFLEEPLDPGVAASFMTSAARDISKALGLGN